MCDDARDEQRVADPCECDDVADGSGHTDGVHGVRLALVDDDERGLVEGADEVVPMDKADHVWGSADFIFCILPATKDTEGLIDAAAFRAMKPSAIFINVGRGSTVVTDDLVDALREGEIAGAGLEVVDPEPLPDDHPLLSLPTEACACC